MRYITWGRDTGRRESPPEINSVGVWLAILNLKFLGVKDLGRRMARWWVSFLQERDYNRIQYESKSVAIYERSDSREKRSDWA
jgi:hypothetical protein